ncbi:MAG: ECF-type sigma factor [Holophagales bacterium]|nr:ECF-type sigma factor [Holophagales bacterium]
MTDRAQTSQEPTPGSSRPRARIPDESQDFQDLLDAHAAGDRAAFDELVALVYPRLRAVARRQLAGRRHGLLFDTTGLVNEAYLRLARKPAGPCSSPSHFFGVAGRAMRQVLVDYARSRQASKRGRGKEPVSLDESRLGLETEIETVLQVDRVLAHLAEIDPRLVRVIECRFFAGLTEVETAKALAVTARTVQRDWKRAKAWLRAELAAA